MTLVNHRYLNPPCKKVLHFRIKVMQKVFTPEEEACFAIRYNEGYDIPDARYLSWLQLDHHNESCQEIIDYFPDVDPLDAISDTVFPSITDTTTDIASSDQSDFALLDTVSISQPSAVPVSSIIDITPGLTPIRSSHRSNCTSHDAVSDNNNITLIFCVMSSLQLVHLHHMFLLCPLTMCQHYLHHLHLVFPSPQPIYLSHLHLLSTLFQSILYSMPPYHQQTKVLLQPLE